MSARANRQAQEPPVPHEPHGGGRNWDRDHQLLRDDSKKWGWLQFAGLFAGTSAKDIYEMRVCPECGTTIHRSVDASRAAKLAAQQADVVARAMDVLSRGVLS